MDLSFPHDIRDSEARQLFAQFENLRTKDVDAHIAEHMGRWAYFYSVLNRAYAMGARDCSTLLWQASDA